MHASRVVLFALVASALGPGCKQESPPTAEEPKAPSAEAAVPRGASEPVAVVPASSGAAPAPASAAVGKSRITESSFDVALEPSGTYQAGQQGVVTVVLDAKPPFHVNDQYPYKFKAKTGPGVTFPAAVVGKESAKLEKQRVTLPVAFVPESKGEHTVAGQFAFSVCTEENCLMEKRDLALVVAVK